MKRIISVCLRGFILTTCWVGLSGCETTDPVGAGTKTDVFSPAVWVSRYEIRVDEGDTTKQSQAERAEAARKREVALRAAVVQFGGALVDQRPQADYTHDAEGNIIPHTVWKITVDVEGDATGDLARELRKRISNAFGKEADVWIIRYPVQKILE